MPKIYMKDFFVYVKEINLTVASFREKGTFTFQFERVFKFKLYMQLMFKRNVSRMK